MWKGKGFRVSLGLVAGPTAACFFLGCADLPKAGQKTVVEIGVIVPLTGGAASACQIGLRNTLDYFRLFQETGIPGITTYPGIVTKLVWMDDALQVSKALSAYDRFVERGVVLVQIFYPPVAEVLKSKCERDEIPAVPMGITEAMMYPPGWLYGHGPTEAERFAVLADWIMENWQGERPPRVALMGSAEYGRATEAQGRKYAQCIGIEMLPMELVPVVPLDTAPQLLRLGERGADYVYITSIWTIALPILRDAERLGLIGKIRFAGVENSQAIPLIQTLGHAAEGYIAPRIAPWYKEVPFLIDMYMKYRGYIDTAGDGASTLVYGSIMIEAVMRAINMVGYENLDGRAVKEALDTIKDFNPHGIKNITYTPEDHRGSAAVRIYQVQGGEVVSLTHWRRAPMLVP